MDDYDTTQDFDQNTEDAILAATGTATAATEQGGKNEFVPARMSWMLPPDGM